jgi:hypothetical protein
MQYMHVCLHAVLRAKAKKNAGKPQETKVEAIHLSIDVRYIHIAHVEMTC